MPLSARLLPLALLPVVALAACSTAPAGPPTPSESAIRVVASTDVWGDVVHEIGGDAVDVTSIITGQDPHEYEPTVRDQLAVSRARLVLSNGGGYDDFMTRLEQSAHGAARLNVADLSGRNQHPSNGEFNEHLWYDLPTARRVAAAVATELSRLLPADTARFHAALGRFDAVITGLQRQEATIARAAGGAGVAITEPVPLYMTAACGLVNRTEAGFSEAVEEGDDVAPAVLRRQLALFTSHRVALLAVNVQTSGATTDQVVSTARAAGVPIVDVRETLPEGTGYLTWMQKDLTAISAVVQR